MFRTLTTGLALSLLFAGASAAEVFDVKMLNRGEAGTMVFEPAFVQIANGDTVRFVAEDRGHNAETIDGMMPEGATGYVGKINEEIEMTFDLDGVYGVRCKPHFALGMVMTIAVGDVAAAPDDFLEGRIPRKAKERFTDQLSNL